MRRRGDIVKRFLSDETGASSVLVVFMMLVLVTLGAYSISSAHVNYIFSERALEWKQAFYECDAKAQDFLMDTDTALAAAEKETAEAVTGGISDIPLENAEQDITGIYNQYVLKELSALADKYDVEIEGDAPEITTVISSDGGSQINVRIAAAPFRYDITSADGVTKCVLNENAKRYRIMEWKEAQKTAPAAMQEPLWDGIVR